MFRCWSSSTPEIFFSFSFVGRPFSNVRVRVSGFSGVWDIGFTWGKASSGNNCDVSSVSFPPMDVPISPIFMEYSVRFFEISMLRDFRNFVVASRESCCSRIGALTFMSGQTARKARSNRTWSFPAPVDPWEMIVAFSFLATSATLSAVITLSAPTHVGYVPPRR